jgi:DNA-binding MarR family transcriptional regulator
VTTFARITSDEMRAWKALRLMTRYLEAHLGRELSQSSGLSMQDYDVLSSIAPLSGHRWCSKKLADHLQWSFSRLSHHLDRMEVRSLVTREPCEHGASIDIVISDEGMRAIRSATAQHLAAVRAAFLDRLQPGDLDTIERLSEAVLEGLPGPVPGRGW